MGSSNAITDSPGSRLKIFRRLKFLVWFQERLRPSDLQVTLIWAGVIGFCGGVSSIAFRVATSIVHKILTGSSAPGLVESFSQMPRLLRLIVPAVGGLLAGAILQFGTRLRGRVATTDYMEAVVLGDGKIAARRTLLKCLSSLFTIASGGSIGREGPLVQLSALAASLAGRLRKWSTPRLRLLVGCGAAAGIASAYNAPIAGALFVAEIVLGSVAMEIFGPLVFSSVIATLTVRAFLGADPLYAIPAFRLNHSWEIVPYLLLGLDCGSARTVVHPAAALERGMGGTDRGASLHQDVRRRFNRRRARCVLSTSLRQRLQRGKRYLTWRVDLANRRRDPRIQNPCYHRHFRLRRGWRRFHSDAFHRREPWLSLR